MDNDEEMKKQLFQAIVESFNKIGTMAMNQLANGNDGFTLTSGPWTVTLDLERFLEDVKEQRGGEDGETESIPLDKMGEIIARLVKPWHENLKKKRGKNELEGNQEQDIH